ncbi:unnamed protein product [Ixodes persulcatus]
MYAYKYTTSTARSRSGARLRALRGAESPNTTVRGRHCCNRETRHVSHHTFLGRRRRAKKRSQLLSKNRQTKSKTRLPHRSSSNAPSSVRRAKEKKQCRRRKRCTAFPCPREESAKRVRHARMVQT